MIKNRNKKYLRFFDKKKKNLSSSLENGKAVVNHKICLLCGYCNPVCPEFAIRLI
jgi:NAD-dependent dihydropyrimidine dehydrogenase PreA subunit